MALLSILPAGLLVGCVDVSRPSVPTPFFQSPTAASLHPTTTALTVGPADTSTSIPSITQIIPSPTDTTVSHFNTLPPGSQLPSDAQCAALVRARPENKGMNVIPNATLGNQRLAGDFFGGSDPLANSYIAPRVTGNYTGTTDMILQWVACKWGIDEDIVRAQAVKESNWHQNSLGDWTTDASRCAPGHGLGVDGKAGQCPQSWGILQVKYIYYASSWPGISTSTAFAADTAYGVWRACYEGYETWLGPKYTAGDLWGCVGRWYAGKWYNQPAADYIAQVQDDLNTRSWETANFQEP